jgi:hypothetical protein
MVQFWRVVRTVVAVMLLLQAVPASVQAAELVVSTTDLSVQISGPWQQGNDYLFRPAGSGGATVFWPFPQSLGSGQYEVFANWVSGADRATNATYFVASSDGTQPIAENQQQNGSNWQSLGTFAFETGKGQGVTLTDSATGIVVAGAVRFATPGNAPAAATPSPSATTAQSGTSTPAATTVQSGTATPAATTAQSGTATPAATASPSAGSPPAATPSAVATAAATPSAGSTSAQPDASAPAPTVSPQADANWTVTLGNADLHAGPDASTDTLANLGQFSYLQILGYSGDWAYVFNPRARGTAYVRSNLLGPSDPPPAWVTAPPPAPQASIEQMGRTVGKAPLAFYPVDDKFAYTNSLGHNVPILVHDRVQAPDGSTWYRVDNGYLSAGSVRLPRPPTKNFSGRWIDADLQEPAMLTAYEGSRVVLNTLAIKGTIANQTPTGSFSILRRVQDETMDSGTLGIDPHGPGGYHLEHVLNTQYFTNDGASIHYNWWSSNFGYSGSHGCLGVDLQDSQFLWNWADVGTTVVIRS